MTIKCQCADAGCPVHKGKSACTHNATIVLVRVDMDDRTGTAFCMRCADDAFDSGLFREDVSLTGALHPDSMLSADTNQHNTPHDV